MRILVVDIGNTNIKSTLFENQSFQFVSVVKTPGSALEMLKEAKKMIDTLSIPIDVILPLSFGDSLMYRDSKDQIQIVKPLDMSIGASVNYMQTGYPEKLAGIHQIYRHRKDIGTDFAPVSNFWASWLTETEIIGWDFTHASNSGMWDQKKQHLFVSDTQIYPPSRQVGNYKSARVLLGGHDIAFIDEDTYLQTGTWLIASKRCRKYTPNIEERCRVRWLRDAKGNLCKQLSLLYDKQHIDLHLQQIIAFLGKRCKITITGRYADEYTTKIFEANAIFPKSIRPRAQETDAASYIHNRLDNGVL